MVLDWLLTAAAGCKKTTIGATYVTGPYTIAISGDDQDDQDWDASVAMASGDTTITVAADETEMMSVGIAYTAGAYDISVLVKSSMVQMMRQSFSFIH